MKVETLLTLIGPLLLSRTFHETVFGAADSPGVSSAASENSSSDDSTFPARSESPDLELLSTFDSFTADELSMELHERSTGGAFVLKDESNDSVAMFRKGDSVSAKEFLAFSMAKPGTVPRTMRVELADGSFASIQKFLPSVEDAEDYGYGLFSVESVQDVALLDVRILNLDRHTGNLMLVPKRGGGGDDDENEKFDVVGIDHELSFPTLVQLKDVTLCWTHWPQAKAPLVRPWMVLEIDVLEDLKRMAAVGLNVEQQLATMMSTAMLKLGVANGLTLAEIGSMMQREGDRTKPSVLERCFFEAVTKTFESDAWAAASSSPSAGAEVALEFADAFRAAAESFVLQHASSSSSKESSREITLPENTTRS